MILAASPYRYLETMDKYGFTQKWIRQDYWTGDWHSAYKNPSTDEWAGGKPSTHY